VLSQPFVDSLIVIMPVDFIGLVIATTVGEEVARYFLTGGCPRG